MDIYGNIVPANVDIAASYLLPGQEGVSVLPHDDPLEASRGVYVLSYKAPDIESKISVTIAQLNDEGTADPLGTPQNVTAVYTPLKFESSSSI